jgi:hypothetical protein
LFEIHIRNFIVTFVSNNITFSRLDSRISAYKLKLGDNIMPSELKSATSRANGAKSKGPITPEGKAQSSHNATTHGFTSKKTIVLACENPDRFQEMLADYAETYQPGCPVEKDLVDEMVACRWRILRLRMMETALLDSEMERELPASETSSDTGYRMAFAFRRLVDQSRAISLISRHESRLHRIHERSHHTLRELQKNSPSVSAGASEPLTPAPVQPEPPPPSVEQAPPSPVDEKSRKEPTPLAPAAARKARKPLSFVRYHRAVAQAVLPVWFPGFSSRNQRQAYIRKS